MDINNIVKLWHKTQIGHHLECKKAQSEFADAMWKLYDNLEKEKTLQQCFGDEVI